MEEGAKEDEFSFAELKLLISMAMIDKPKLMTLSMLAEKINTQQSSPIFQKVVNYLKVKNILTTHPYIANTKIVTIDDKRLTDIVDDHIITLFFFNYFKEWHFITW